MNVSGHINVPAAFPCSGTYQYVPVPISTFRYLSVRSGAYQYVPVPISTFRYLSVRSGTYQYVPVPISMKLVRLQSAIKVL
jgi:hypothetical protein